MLLYCYSLGVNYNADSFSDEPDFSTCSSLTLQNKM